MDQTALATPALLHLQSLVAECAAMLTSVDEVTDHQLRVLLQQTEQVINSATAVQATTLAEMADRADESSTGVAGRDTFDPLHDVLVSPEFLGDEVALLLGCSAVSGHRRLESAKAAARHLVLMECWAAGVVDRASVDVIAELVAPLPADATTHELVADAIDHAIRHTPSQTRAWLTRRVLAADPAAAAERRERASAARRVQVSQGADGMASLWAWLPGAQARQVYDTVHAVAMAADTDDARSMDQRRADALVDLVVGRATPPQVHFQVVASAQSLTGMSDEPAEIVGVGPMLVDELFGLPGVAANFTMRHLLTDPDCGTLTGLSERQYRPSAGLRRAIELRDVTCRFPGCRRAASGRGTDIDHTVPWPEGPTAADNLAVLCRRHHRLKHSEGWSVTLEPDGAMTWTTPSGRRFSTTAWCYSDPRAP